MGYGINVLKLVKLSFPLILICLLVPHPGRSQGITLIGAGATFPEPLYQKWFELYRKEREVKVNYQGVGSGEGIRRMLQRSIDFGGTDAFLTDEEMAKAPAPILHLPTAIGAVVITYNLPGQPVLKLTPDLIVDLFLGKVKKWNDPRILKINPTLNLPDLEITLIHRSDGSGTTFILSDYLSKVSPEWEKKVGSGKVLKWPSGLGVEKNSGVANMVRQVNGGMGYVEYIYAEANRLPFAAIQNRFGQFVAADLRSVSLAAHVDLPPDTRASITHPPTREGYPISGFTWVLFYKEQDYQSRSRERALALVNLLWWMVHQGQIHNETLSYARLPKSALERAQAVIHSTTYREKPLKD